MYYFPIKNLWQTESKIGHNILDMCPEPMYDLHPTGVNRSATNHPMPMADDLSATTRPMPTDAPEG